MDDEDFFANYPPATGTEETKADEERKGSEDQPSETSPSATKTTVADVDENEEDGEPLSATKEAILTPAPPGDGDGKDESVGEVMKAEKVEIDGLDEGAKAEENGDGEKEEGEEEKVNEKVLTWRREFAKRLEEKVAREKKVKAERMESAEELLKSMNEKWVKKCEKNKEDNREQEKVFLAERDGLIGRMSKKGEKPNWSLVENFADLTGKYKQGQRDTSRMRQVILRMKTAQQSS